jgi:hypothetical protein
MQEEDYEVLRNEANADEAHFAQWDPNRQFRSEYAQLHPHDPKYKAYVRAEQAAGREPVAARDPIHAAVAEEGGRRGAIDAPVAALELLVQREFGLITAFGAPRRDPHRNVHAHAHPQSRRNRHIASQQRKLPLAAPD